jgi:hypothetical protein
MPTVDEERVRRIAELVRRLGEIPDRESREAAHELMEAIMQLHGAGLERMMEIAFDAGESGRALIRRFAGDSLAASLLVLHGLHPDDLETRVQQALGKLHGKAELMGAFEGVVRVRLIGNARGLKESVEAALWEAVPDAAEIVIEEGLPANGFVPLAALGMAAPKGA